MLYLIQSGEFSKIGYASDINRRISSYNTHNPDFNILYTREGSKKEESELHKILKNKIHHGERMLHSKEIEDIFTNHIFKKETSISKSEREKYETEIKYLNKLISELKEKIQTLEYKNKNLQNTINVSLNTLEKEMEEQKKIVELIKQNYQYK